MKLTLITAFFAVLLAAYAAYLISDCWMDDGSDTCVGCTDDCLDPEEPTEEPAPQQVREFSTPELVCEPKMVNESGTTIELRCVWISTLQP